MTFPATNWTVLAEATLSGGESEQEALGRLCECYWDPISVVIRARGVAVDRVEDLTQDFFMVLMKGGFFRRAEQAKGKFRTFLLNALRNFLADDARKTATAKRGGDLEQVELREETVAWEEEGSRFDWAWASALFESAVAETGSMVKKVRGERGWEALRKFLTGDGEGLDYEELAEVLGVRVGAAKTEVSRMRSRFRDHLRAAVMRTVGSPHEVEEELVFLREALVQRSLSGDDAK